MPDLRLAKYNCLDAQKPLVSTALFGNLANFRHPKPSNCRVVVRVAIKNEVWWLVCGVGELQGLSVHLLQRWV